MPLLRITKLIGRSAFGQYWRLWRSKAFFAQLQTLVRRFSKISALCCLALCAAISGCAHTALVSAPNVSRLSELAAANSTPLAIKVNWEVPSQASLGRQFALLVFPLGSVEAGALEEIVRNNFFARAALCGYRPLMGYSSSPLYPNASSLEVTVADATASAYDLIAVRRLSCGVSLRAHLAPSSLPATEVDGHFSTFSRFGFQEELSTCMQSAVEQGVRKLFAELHLC